MKPYILLAALALAACTGPKSGQIVTIPPGPHMTTAHPAFTACGGPAEKLPSGEWRCR